MRSDRELPEPESKGIPQVVNELWALTKDYARQETIDPLKGLGRYLGYGFFGAVLGAFGISMLLLALLRGLQTFDELRETNWSFVPYLVVLVVGVIVAGIAWSRIQKK